MTELMAGVKAEQPHWLLTAKCMQSSYIARSFPPPGTSTYLSLLLAGIFLTIRPYVMTQCTCIIGYLLLLCVTYEIILVVCMFVGGIFRPSSCMSPWYSYPKRYLVFFC